MGPDVWGRTGQWKIPTSQGRCTGRGSKAEWGEGRYRWRWNLYGAPFPPRRSPCWNTGQVRSVGGRVYVIYVSEAATSATVALSCSTSDWEGGGPQPRCSAANPLINLSAGTTAVWMGHCQKSLYCLPGPQPGVGEITGALWPLRQVNSKTQHKRKSRTGKANK